MKKILFLTLLSFGAQAAPILNQNMAAEGSLITIWPDHVDPNHFYFAPSSMKIAHDNKGLPKFHFTEYNTGLCDRRRDIRRGYCLEKAMLTSLMTAGFEELQLAQAQAGILKIHPDARFSPIPFLSSKVDFGTSLDAFIDKHDCAPKAGQVADEIPCTIILNRRGIETLKPFLNEGKIIPFKFVYQIAGVIEGANGQFMNDNLEYGLTVNLGGQELQDHPELED